MNNVKGGLIKKKQKPKVMQPAVHVKKPEMDFGYSDSVPTTPVQAVVEQEVKPTELTTPTTKTVIGKTNSTKSLKVPTLIHSELNLLGSFMDENKTYMILQTLIDSYVKNELSDRQQRQFKFMVEAFNADR